MEDTKQTDPLGDFDDIDWGEGGVIIANGEAQRSPESLSKPKRHADKTNTLISILMN